MATQFDNISWSVHTTFRILALESSAIVSPLFLCPEYYRALFSDCILKGIPELHSKMRLRPLRQKPASTFLSRLPNEVLYKILEHLCPPGALYPFDFSKLDINDSKWHQALLDGHLHIIKLSAVSKQTRDLVATVQQQFVKLIANELQAGTIYQIPIKRIEKIRVRTFADGIDFFTEFGYFRNGYYQINFWELQAIQDVIDSIAERQMQAQRVPFETEHWQAIGREHIRRACACAVEVASVDDRLKVCIQDILRFVPLRQMQLYDSPRTYFSHLLFE